MFEKVFQGNGEPHSSTYEAEDWLKKNGYSFGPSSVDGPAGVVKGEGHYISKWRNMSVKERKAMDGKLFTSRSGRARVVLKQEPINLEV